MHRDVSLDAPLPAFDPTASRTKWNVSDFASRQKRDSRQKAKWIVAILHPDNRRQRSIWLNAFEAVFTSNTTDRYFSAIRKIASEIDSADLLLNAIELKELWEDRADFQRHRSLRGQARVISLPKAMRIAKAREHYFVVDMVEPDWLEEWQRLRKDERGFWSFAEYAVHRAEMGSFEDWDVASFLKREERLWTRGYADPIGSSGVSSQIGRRRRRVPDAVFKRYVKWRAKQDGPADRQPKQRESETESATSLNEQMALEYVKDLVDGMIGSQVHPSPEFAE